MTIRVYTVTREGLVTARRPIVTVPYDHTAAPSPMSTALPPCACPIHRAETGR
ncbi:hypothetical protein [Streptomyces sp. LaPpAH-108]|uniref:hypothetical protein n=1 Tax=Streptomyces sp. LaPpAH-108 TaxID=1155714 RepID=UPI00035D1C6A|nr:hypothetical protein [Streptomyces sp. LaPpAH-108]